MPLGGFVPNRIHTDYVEWTAPGIAYDGQVWAWNNTNGQYEPTALSFDPAGTAAAAVAAHVALSNPHSQYLLASSVSAYGATLIDDADATATRSTLGLGTAAVLNVGTSANNVVQLDGSARLPAVDGSQLTGISGGSGSPGGSTTQVQFNDGGSFGGDAGLTYAKATDRLTVAGGLIAPSMRPASDSTTALQFMTAAGVAFITGDSTNRRLFVDAATNSNDCISVKGGNGTTRLHIGSFADVNYIYSNAKYVGGFTQDDAAFASWGLEWGGGTDALKYRRSAAGSVSFVDLLWMDSTGRLGLSTIPTALLDLAASTTTRASLRIRSGTAPTSPNDGDVWFNGTNFQCRIGGVTRTFTVT